MVLDPPSTRKYASLSFELVVSLGIRLAKRLVGIVVPVVWIFTHFSVVAWQLPPSTVSADNSRYNRIVRQAFRFCHSLLHSDFIPRPHL